LIFTLFGLLLAVSMLSHLSFGGILFAAFALTVGGTVLWSLVPRKDRSEPEGVPIDLSQEVRLRADVVAPVAATGFRPPLADGFARFMTAPAIAKAAAAALETQLAGGAEDPLNSHPPLSARLEKARTLAITARHNDERPAVSLIDDLTWLERQLLQKLAPNVKVASLKSIHWDSAGSEVYIPLWRSMTASLQPLLAQRTVSALPEALSTLAEMANRIPDPPGTLLTREQRMGRAMEALSHILTLTLVDHGWQLYLQPGQFYMEREGARLESGSVVANLKSGKLTAASWVEYCEKSGIGGWPLSAVSS
jgi:hypothetical protein